MNPPKKAAKKTASKHKSQDDSNDMRRAYEHLGRVEVLHSCLQKDTVTGLATLTELARRQLAAGNVKEAADLLRTAEHLGFGAAQSEAKDGGLEPKLIEAITKEFRHKQEKAGEHWSGGTGRDEDLHAIYSSAIAEAQSAFDGGAYHRALELIRGAEALAHVKPDGVKQLAAAAGSAS